MLYWEVYEDKTHNLIGFVKTRTYEDAIDEAFKRYKRPVTLIYHDPLNKEEVVKWNILKLLFQDE